VNLSRRAWLGLLPGICAAADDPLLGDWRRIAAKTDGVVGASALHLSTGRQVSWNGGQRFPLASVCKLPLAIHILAMVDEGKLPLAGEIEVPVYDVVPNVSPLAARWPRERKFPLPEMLELMIAQSDNTAVQTLFRAGGGRDGMAARFRQWGIDGMRLDRSERQCGLDAAGVSDVPPVEQWTPDMAAKLSAQVPAPERLAAMRRFAADPRDTATPDATIALLRKAFAGELLTAPLTARLIAMMEKTSTGSGRIRGLLPAGTVVAHKTGTTGSAGAFNAGTNDVGVIGGKLAIAVYVRASTRGLPKTERLIAEVARAAYQRMA